MTTEQEKRLFRIKTMLPQYEDVRRVTHTMGVYEECLWFASVFDLCDDDMYSLLAAALLHDLTKSLPDDKARALCLSNGISLPEGIPSVFHQYTVAPFAKEIFGDEIVNDRVVSAVSCHTTGKPNMSILDRMLFVSDFTEPGRKYRSCVDMREYLHKECEKINKNDKAALCRLLDDVTRKIIGFTMTYLIEKGRRVDVEMILAWNAMVM